MMGEIRYDHENVHSIAAALREQADQMRRDTAEKTRAAHDAIVEEASRYTRSGEPAPIFAEVIREADKALAAIIERTGTIIGAMRDHADILDGAIIGARQIEEDAAASMSAVDVDLTPEQQALVGTKTAEGGTYIIGPDGGLSRTKEAWAPPSQTGSSAAAAVLGD